MARPLVSVVVPTYDRPHLLHRALQSVQAQTHERLEVVVVDGPSRIPASEVVADSPIPDQQCTCIRHEDPQGVAAARNAGIAAAEGDYVAFLDDDDEWLPEKTEKQLQRFHAAVDDVGVVYAGVRQVNEHGVPIAVKTPAIEGDVLKALLCRNFVGTLSSVMIRADAIERVGTFDDRFPAWEDWDYYVRLAREVEFGAVAKPYVIRHSGDHEQTSDDYTSRRDVASEVFISKHESLAASFGWQVHRRMRANVEFYLAEAGYANGRYRDARDHVFRALKWYPLQPKYYLFGGLLAGGKHTFGAAQKLKRRLVSLLAE